MIERKNTGVALTLDHHSLLKSKFSVGRKVQYICCCCSAYLSSCNRTTSNPNLLDDLHTFHYQDYFVNGIYCIRTCLGVSDDPMFLWISSNSCPLNLLLVRSHQAEIIIVKRLIQGRNNVTRVWVEPRPFDQGRRKNDAFTHLPTLPTDICTNICTNIQPHVKMPSSLLKDEVKCQDSLLLRSYSNHHIIAD